MKKLHDNPNWLAFRCDDNSGFELRILRANDGDFHVAVVPVEGGDLEQYELCLYDSCFSASVRLRMPMIGGGSHLELFNALVPLFNPKPEGRCDFRGRTRR